MPSGTPGRIAASRDCPSAAAKVRHRETLELHLQRRSFEYFGGSTRTRGSVMGPVTVGHQFLDRMTCRINILLQNTIFRYLFGIAAVASVFVFRIWLIRLTGTGGPFVL